MKNSLPLKLVLIVIFALFFEEILSIEIKRYCYSVSFVMKEILVWLLPLLVFSFISSCVARIGKGSIKILLFTVAAICLSNYLSSILGFCVGNILINFTTLGKVNIANNIEPLDPLFSLNLLKIISNDMALLIGTIIGVLVSLRSKENEIFLLERLKDYSMFFLNKIFIPLVPLFIFGFVIKFAHEDKLSVIIKIFGLIIFAIIFAQLLYISILLVFASRGDLKKVKIIINNLIAPCLVGFTAMSSAAAMPLSIKAASDSLDKKNQDKPKLFVPLISNIHLIGDGVFVPTIAYILANSFGYETPNFAVYAIFGVYFVIAKFAVAGVPGGGILVMLPILEQYFGMTGEMLSLITAIYIIFDSFITTINISGNIIFSVLLSRLQLSDKD